MQSVIIFPLIMFHHQMALQQELTSWCHHDAIMTFPVKCTFVVVKMASSEKLHSVRAPLAYILRKQGFKVS